MKKIKLSLFLVAGLLILGGCASEPTEEVGTVKNTGEKVTTEGANQNEEKGSSSEKAQKDVVLKSFEGITYNVPSNYIEMESDVESPLPIVLYVFDGTSSFNIVVEDLASAPGITLEQYIDYSVASTGFDYISNKYYELNGLDWNEAVSTNQGVKLQQTSTIVDGKAYIFTYGGLPESFDKHLEDVKQILKSVKFK